VFGIWFLLIGWACFFREMAVGNTFGATALSSYGGFWLSFAIVLTPGGFGIVSAIEDKGGVAAFHNSFGFFLFVGFSPSPLADGGLNPSAACGCVLITRLQGWFIFTTILLICTLKSTVAFFSLFFTLDLAFLCLAISFIKQGPEGEVHPQLTIAGGVFGMLAALLAWYNALAGIADTSNRYVPLFVVF
jgi:uncharacterized protein